MLRLLRINGAPKTLSAWSSSSIAHLRSIATNQADIASPETPKVAGFPAESADKANVSETKSDHGQNHNESVDTQGSTERPETLDDITVPWYLRNDITSHLLEEKEVKIPAIPPHAPPHVSEFLSLLATDYGMENLLLFDMTVLDESHEFKASNRNVDFVVICTGKSERHILKAATEFRTHIKHKFRVLPATEGIVSTAKTPAMRRKLLRRARKGPSSTDNEYGRAANSWVLFHHDNVDVHIMTSERRHDLNLEALWCPPEDVHLYEQQQTVYEESDHIFSGIRHFHTSTGRRAHSDSAHYDRLLSQPADVGENTLRELKTDFDREFRPRAVADFRVKFQFYKTVHIQDPNVVSFEDAEGALLEKYASEIDGDIAAEKISDVTEYAKLLLDSPATQIQDVGSVDTALDKLSRFISVLYRFSSEHFSMAADPAFIPLLWRLTFWEKARAVTPRDVDQFIGSRDPPQFTLDSVGLASNNARNVLTLIGLHNTTTGHGRVTPAFRELVLYTYGNAGKWDDFWHEWNAAFFPNSPSPQAALSSWVRLVTYLSLLSNPAQTLHFFDHYWRNGSLVSGSVMECLEKNGGRFASENERMAFVKATRSLVDSLDPNKDIFVQIRKQLDDMEEMGEIGV